MRKCPYCDFYSLAYSAEKAREYTDAVVRNLLAIKDTYGENLLADTLYFGGGTPILLGEELIRILDAAKCILTHTDGIEPEISFEAILTAPITMCFHRLISRIQPHFYRCAKPSR